MDLDCYITTRAIITLYKQIMVQLFSIEEKAVEKLLVVPIVTRVGFEPTKHDAVDLKSTPFDRSGTLPCRTIVELIILYYRYMFLSYIYFLLLGIS